CAPVAHARKTWPNRCSRHDLVAAPAANPATAVSLLLRARPLELRCPVHERPMPHLWVGAGRSADRARVADDRPPDGLAGFRAPRAGNHAFAGWAHRGPVCRLHSSYGTGSPAGHHRLGRANGVVLALSVRGTRENLIRLCGCT